MADNVTATSGMTPQVKAVIDVSVRLQGACRGCPGAAMTLKMGVERLLKEKVPQVKGVVPVQ